VPQNIQAVVDRALEAYSGLVELGESIEDEWSYVNGLAEAWERRLTDVAGQRGPELVPVAVGNAIERVVDEIGLIEDPHRAIDWLSTFPQVVLLALAEVP
jgi:hypothetical protein